MATHADDKEVDHLVKVDGGTGLCKVTTEYSPELYSSTSRVFTVIAKPRLLHALVILCYGFQCLTASIAKTATLCLLGLPQRWHWSQVQSRDRLKKPT